jgi:DNA-binding response OmpR family regulator
MPDGLRERYGDGVLVIDDDASLLHSFEHVLEAHGIPVATARDGYEGFATFRWSSPAVVLTDIFMPEQYRTAVAMRSARPGVKIVAMSGANPAGRLDFLTIAKKLGADAVVHKPFEVSDLVKLLRTFVRRRQYETGHKRFTAAALR